MKWCLQNPKLCGFYIFQKEYLDELIDKKIVIIDCEEVKELEERSQGSEYANHEEKKDLEKKMENLMWKMNCFIVVVAIVVFGIVVRSVAMT